MESDQVPVPDITIRDALTTDGPLLAQVDSAAVAGNSGRIAEIQHWLATADTRIAHSRGQVTGYCVTEYTFFGQAFVTMLMVAENTRGLGVGARLLLDAQQRRNTPKLFTSTNLSNQPMQRLLTRLGWQSAGIVYGLDDGDPELFFLAPADTQLP
ncbi:GNAT family N-acetyltransferase [Amycolatopsis sp. WAC 04182]|uniref:GNAT family N-acetyltransferase n=1 Tax=Amycolatopsis sp. WAC 04182 TaxID=2203198 RepID=UPI000F7824C1|nr:GNAT family N-acetyltransferase [Amycolatopsis sp. WAC 04182]RSN61250.1 GNAT family N-acetyltransferase [Amycolatopsis sp. WAC 04182]